MTRAELVKQLAERAGDIVVEAHDAVTKVLKGAPLTVDDEDQLRNLEALAELIKGNRRTS